MLHIFQYDIVYLTTLIHKGIKPDEHQHWMKKSIVKVDENGDWMSLMIVITNENIIMQLHPK